MSRRLQATSFALIVGLLATGIYEQSRAQQDTSEPAQSPTKLIRIPTSGYRPKPISSESEKGKELFRTLNCMACHTTHGVGGTMGPVLDAVGQRRDEFFLMAHLSESADEIKRFAQFTGVAESDLVHPRVSDQAAGLLTAFLLTLPEPPGGFVIEPHQVRLPSEQPETNTSFKPATPTEATAEGKRLYEKSGCMACHSISNIGGWFGPALDGICGRRTRDYIILHISGARVHFDTRTPTQMPELPLSRGEIQKIASYLETLPSLKK